MAANAQVITASLVALSRRPRCAYARAMDPTPADSALMLRYRDGDVAAFEVLYRRHNDALYRYLLRLTQNRDAAEDVFQEAWGKIVKAKDSYRRTAKFTTFLYRVAMNAALNRRRSLGRSRDRVQKLELRQAAGDDLPPLPPNPEASAASAEVSEHVQAALETLPPSLRFPVVLYDIEGLPYGEISRILGIAEGTVKSRIHRARKALRSQLRGVLSGAIEGAAK